MNETLTKPSSSQIDPLSDEKIADSWKGNAAAWTTAIREDQIESRKLVTNAAILEAIVSRTPKSVLDIGCGEGWLARHLEDLRINVLGTDVVPALIERAREGGKGRFEVLSYEDLAEGKLSELFDVAVCNFALLGKESVDNLLRVVPKLLKRGGALIVQTVHPVFGCGELPYVDGWRQGSWAGFSSDFTDPAPWYFRTIESWIKLFTDNKFVIQQIKEPWNPKTQKAASIIIVGEAGV